MEYDDEYFERYATEILKHRPKESQETIDQYREAVAQWFEAQGLNPIYAFEIRFKKRWDQWDEGQKLEFVIRNMK